MRIVIDLQGAQTGSRFRGIGRYSLSLVEGMVRNCDDHEIIITLNGLFPETIESIRAEFDGLLPQENIRVWYTPGHVAEINKANVWRREASECIREAFLVSLSPDFVLLTTLFEGFGDDFVASVDSLEHRIPTAVILYDLIPLMNSETYLADPATLAWYQNKVSHCKRARLLLSISESSRQEAIEHLGAKEDAVVNISSAIESTFRPVQLSKTQQKELRSKFGLQKEFLMYSGATDFRKNHRRLIKAYSQLPLSLRSQHQLAFVGGLPEDHRSSFLSYAAECGLVEHELIITGRVTDDEMIALYNLCKAFVFPSWHEGFGLPALEAMSCGRAVIASNTSSLPEVVGYSDALFDPFNEQSIAQKIEQVLTDDDFRANLEQHGLERSKKFSWDATAKRSIIAMDKYHEQFGSAQLDTVGINDNDTLLASLIESISKLSSPFSEADLLSTAEAIAQNYQTYNKRQLLVDISELKQNDAGTGIQRVTRNILSELLNNPPNGWRVEPVYASHNEGYRYARRFTQRFLNSGQEELVDDPVEYYSNDIFLGLDLLHPSIASFNGSFYQSLRNHGVKVFFIVYDILPILLPQYANEGVSVGHVEWLKEVTKSDGVICISKAVADEVHTWIVEHTPNRLRPFNISWFHLGADIENSVSSKGLPGYADKVLSLVREHTSFLMVGTIEPRKGHAQTFSAFEQLWQKGVDANLIIVGKQGWKVEELVEKIRSHPELHSRLFWLDSISDEYLEKVYAASSCLIAASEGEGFGLPLIEAAQHKLPIIARNIPVFHEVAGDHAFYFDGKEPAELATAIQNWLKLYKSNQHPSSDSMPWLTWKESAAQLLEKLGVTTLETYKDLKNS
jgi:glycosyltransferase involved in cell wall biosynthesis